MTIRQATITDIDGILRLLRQIFIIHAGLRPDLFATRTKRTKYDAIELADIIADSEERPLFVACDDNDEVIAYAMCIVEHSPNGIITLYLDDLCVEEHHRECSIGSQLFAFVKEYAKQHGCYNLTLHVWHGNDRARSFYEAIGMTEQYRCLELKL